MSEEKVFNEFVYETSQLSEKIMGLSHIDAEVKSNISDLNQIIKTLQSRVDNSSGQSGDMRLLKKRFDTLKNEAAYNSKEVERFKTKVVPAILVEIKRITGQINAIKRELKNSPNDTITQATMIMEVSLKKLFGVF